MKADIYQAITARFIEQLKRGTVPWQKPWFAVQNLVSRRPYRGINALLLGSTDYQSPFWLGFRQALDLGGHVKKGEKSTPVIYYKILEKRDDAGNIVLRPDGTASRIPFVRWANVFNLDQTEGIQAPAITTAQSSPQPLEKAASIVENAKLCPIHHAGFAASYSPADDLIRIPVPLHLSQPGRLLPHSLPRDSRVGSQFSSQPGGCHSAREIWFGTLLQRRARWRIGCGVPLERSRHPGLGAFRELGRLPRLVGRKAGRRSTDDHLRSLPSAAGERFHQGNRAQGIAPGMSDFT